MGSTQPMPRKQGNPPAPIPYGTQGVIGNQGIQGLYPGYNVMTQGVIDATTYFNDKISADKIEDAVLEILDKYGVKRTHPSEEPMDNDEPKTFTLEEVITIIEAAEPRLNINSHGLWENKTERLVDKDELIKIFKSI